MGYNNPDVYYQPEKFDLTPIGQVEWDDESWQFNMTAVWVDKFGQLYWADDSGCSCPSPFEDFTSLDHPDLNKGSFNDLTKYLFERLEGVKEANAKYSWHNYDPEPEVVDLVAKCIPYA